MHDPSPRFAAVQGGDVEFVDILGNNAGAQMNGTSEVDTIANLVFPPLLSSLMMP